jgi:UDP-N-acetylmuramate dehydrogenase
MSFQIPNTLALPCVASAGGFASSIDDVRTMQSEAGSHGLPFRVIGQGSNIVPAATVAQFVCVMRSRGIVVSSTKGRTLVEVAAGESWHNLVVYCVSQGLFGLENLALIPGTVGAAPIQNIGAYGVELADFVASVTVCDEYGKERLLSREECGFSYRSSIFKTRPELVVVSVTLMLSREFSPKLDYPDVIQEVGSATPMNAKTLVDAIVAIRRRKLPDPEVVPNVGSYFKNPIVSERTASRLRSEIDNLVAYSTTEGVKLSAAQLIDLAGWKNRPAPTVGCWDQQALVVINLGGATTQDVTAFTTEIQRDILSRYSVQLDVEPSLLS